MAGNLLDPKTNLNKWHMPTIVLRKGPQPGYKEDSLHSLLNIIGKFITLAGY